MKITADGMNCHVQGLKYNFSSIFEEKSFVGNSADGLSCLNKLIFVVEAPCPLDELSGIISGLELSYLEKSTHDEIIYFLI